MANPGMTEEEKEAIKKQLEEEMEAKMRENQRLLDEMNKSWEEKLKEAQAKVAVQAEATEDSSGKTEAKRRETEAHILNINEDLMLSRAICYFFPPDKVTVFGNRSQPGKEDVLLGGLSIRPEHCAVSRAPAASAGLSAARQARRSHRVDSLQPPSRAPFPRSNN